MNWITIDWKGFGRTRGGFVDAAGQPTYPPRQIIEGRTNGCSSTGGWCAPPSPFYSFADGTPVGWDNWVEWRRVTYVSIRDLMPSFSASRGGITWLRPPHG